MEYRIMSDNEVSKNTLSDNSDTEKKEAAALSSGSKASGSKASGSNVKVSAATTGKNKAVGKAATKKPSPSNTRATTEKTTNKTATLALIIASVSVFASIGHYVWQQQQTSVQLLALSQQNKQAIQQSQAQLKSNLTAEFNQKLQQQNKLVSQSQQNAQQSHLDRDDQIQQLTIQLQQLEQQVSQRQPNDWLIHEAEYLVRVAARTMWLERDTKAAIGLLRDADNRLKELDQPKFLPVRALINEDIENLALMPTLQNQEVILTLMALNKQVSSLKLADVNLAESFDEKKADFALSDNIDDWQDNLAKTWHKFLNDFITVRRRTSIAEPLMTPTQQQNLQQNLSLKIQLVQWAASEQKENVYQQTLLDIQQWLNEFFDMSLPVNQKFYQSIEQLKQEIIYYDYPSDLRSLTAIKRLLQQAKRGTKPQSTAPVNNTEQVEKPATEQGATKQVSQDITPASAPEKNPSLESEAVSGGQL